MKTKNISKAAITFYLLIFSLPLMVISCEDKDEKEPDALVGTYVFTDATFEETVGITMDGMYHEFSQGSDASPFVSEGLLGAAPCDDSTNAAIEFRADGKSFYVCLGETNESQMGTWIINAERTVFTLNISNPIAFSLAIKDLNLTETVISGTVENFPLPLTTAVPLGQVFGNPPVPNFQVKQVNVTFTRVP